MTQRLAIAFEFMLNRWGRQGLADFAGLQGEARDAMIRGEVETTIEALREVLLETRELSVFAILANPEIGYVIDDPDDGPLFSEGAVATIRLSIPTSSAHLGALAGWAKRPLRLHPALFEAALREAIQTTLTTGG